MSRDLPIGIAAGTMPAVLVEPLDAAPREKEIAL